jgi:hypothetical protein
MRSLVAVRRPNGSTGTPLRSTKTVYPEVEQAWAELRPPKLMASSFGAGEQPTGSMEAELHEGADVRFRDVLEVLAGPEAGTAWRVVAPPHRPGNGPLLVMLELFSGDLPYPPPPPPPEP